MTEETVLRAEAQRKKIAGNWPALALIAAGVLILISKLFGLILMDFLWPGFIIGFGLLLMYPAHLSTADEKKKLSFFAVPGAMSVALGLLLFMMNLVNHFESMAYSWPLLLAAGAGGYLYQNRFDETAERKDEAHRFIRFMVLLFMAMAMFFELLIFQSFGNWWPLVIIGLGGYMLVKERRSKSNE